MNMTPQDIKMLDLSHPPPATIRAITYTQRIIHLPQKRDSSFGVKGEKFKRDLYFAVSY